MSYIFDNKQKMRREILNNEGELLSWVALELLENMRDFSAQYWRSDQPFGTFTKKELT